MLGNVFADCQEPFQTSQVERSCQEPDWIERKEVADKEVVKNVKIRHNKAGLAAVQDSLVFIDIRFGEKY